MIGSDQDLAERLVRSLPAASYELEMLCRVAGIEWSRTIPTAAVTCGERTRLLVNPDFVAQHCPLDEHLFLLVMHELWHVLLAHTRLYVRPTPAHNVAFDAIINAGLARQHPAPEYLEFFERLNPPDVFPGLLLRPPIGWPNEPQYTNVGPKGTASILRALYPPPGGEVFEPTYSEILQLLEESGSGAASEPCSGDSEGDGTSGSRSERDATPTLLGDHDELDGEARDRAATDDDLFGDVVRRIVAKWPPPPFPLGGRDAGSDLRNTWGAVLDPPAHDVRRAFAAVLRRSLGTRHGAFRRRNRIEVPTVSGVGVLPNARDRLAPARRLLGAPTTLWAQPSSTRARVPETPVSAHVYVDVSGSMNLLLPHLLGLLLPYVVRREADVYQFSTEIVPLPLEQLRNAQLQTTGGTSINCVLEHALAAPRLRRALVLTDGYVGPARAELLAELQERHLRVHTVLPHESAWTRDLEPISDSLTVLPPLLNRRATITEHFRVCHGPVPADPFEKGKTL
jgi:Putative metallopeptidase domain